MKKYNLHKTCYLMLMVFFCLSTAHPEANEVNSLAEAFKEGTASLSFRYRWENVDQDSKAKDANASTLRTRLGFETARYNHFQALVEVEDVQDIGNDNFNNTLNGKTDYPVVADPDSTEINQAYLSYYGLADTSIKAGRRLLNLDDQRFVGAVGWRQNSQTFDLVDFSNTSIEDTTIYYGWITQVNRIFGEDSEKGKFNTQTHLLNVKNKSLENVDITTFLYLMDLKDVDMLSSATFGFRANGSYEVAENLDFLFDASYAHQTDYADNPSSLSANFYHLSSGLESELGSFTLGYEVHGSDEGTAAFQTPLATLHKFNGWADIFLSTPDTGLRDFYAGINLQLGQVAKVLEGVKFATRLHDFTADDGGAHYGTEWDFVISKKFLDQYLVALHYANYNAIDLAEDTRKIWLSLSTAWSS